MVVTLQMDGKSAEQIFDSNISGRISKASVEEVIKKLKMH
jgi:hypothetical protein